MKKLIALIIALAFLLSSCSLLTQTPNDSTDDTGITGDNTQNNGDNTNDAGDNNPGGDNPGEDNPGGDNPGEDNPGEDNPGGDNPGGDNPGEDNPGEDNPGGDNPGGDNPGNCTEHTDEDDNGLCDTCHVSVIVWFDFYAINDLHGKILESDSQEGIAGLTTYLKNAYNTQDNVILLSSGDMWQGSSESNLTNGLIITDWMNELGFVSMTLGNHEFDWGDDAIYENMALAQFPLLAINIYDKNIHR